MIAVGAVPIFKQEVRLFCVKLRLFAYFLHGCACGDGAETPTLSRVCSAGPSRRHTRLGRHVSVAAGARRACRRVGSLVTCACEAATTVEVIEHGCSDAAYHLRAEDIPGERAAQPAGPGLRARRALRRRAAAATAARRSADLARRRHRAGRARRDTARGRTHLMLQRGWRAAAMLATDLNFRADGLHVRTNQPRVRRAADLLFSVHA